MSVHNLKKFKEAKSLLPDLKNILKVLSLTEKALEYYNSYSAVQNVIKCIKYEKQELEIYRKIYEKTEKTKGRS